MMQRNNNAINSVQARSIQHIKGLFMATTFTEIAADSVASWLISWDRVAFQYVNVRVLNKLKAQALMIRGRAVTSLRSLELTQRRRY